MDFVSSWNVADMNWTFEKFVFGGILMVRVYLYEKSFFYFLKAKIVWWKV
jgi:hypothetical protein